MLTKDVAKLHFGALFPRYGKMDSCLTEELVERYVAGDCSRDEQQAVETHSTLCEDCRQRIESARTNLATCDKSDSRTFGNNFTNTVTKDIHVKPEKYTTKSMTRGTTAPPEAHADESDYDFSFEGYKILGQIGEGGVGTVWRALQLSTHREVALKVLSTGTFASEKARLRFEREVELTARLEHPNIARIYDSGLNKGVYYYTMALFEGKPLDKYIQDSKLTHREIFELIHNVCQGVQYAHQRGVIHRDLKPSNIIVTSDGEPHILDFGLAKTFMEDDKTVTVSVDGDVAGTPAFMSPEQAAGHLDAIDTRTDVYSMGVILFYVLTNQWPYDISGSHYQTLKNIQEQEPTRPSKIIPHLDADIEAILLKALAKDPSERYHSAAELARDMQYWMDGLPIMARSVNTLYLLKKLIVRHRTASIIVCLLLVIVISFSNFSLYLYSQARSTVKKLQSERDNYEKVSQETLRAVNRVLFATSLDLWHVGETSRAEQSVQFFATESPEKIATLFLLDARPLVEKEAEFREKLSAGQPSFCEFIIGEHHLKNKNEPEAIEAYKRCLAADQDSSGQNDWFVIRAQRKLSELLGEEIPVNSCRGINSGEQVDGTQIKKK